MAKVSSYGAVTQVNAADTIYLIQGGLSKRATLNVPWAFGADVSFAQAVSITGVLTASGQIKAADGSAAAPAYSFSTYPTTGFYVDGTLDNIKISTAGAYIGRFGGTGLRLLAGATQSLAFEGAEGVPDIFLFRDAANTLAQRNGVNAQTFRIYNTFTDASNYERGGLAWASNILYLFTQAAGTGVTTRGIRIETGGAGAVEFSTNATPRWNVNPVGHLLSNADNTYDIGASGANRPRNVYISSVYRSDVASSAVANFVGTGTSGNIQLGVSGANATIHSSSGYLSFQTGASLEQFRVTHTASAVNFINASGSVTGAQVNIGADGTDTNVSFRAYTKGTGSFEVITNGQSGSRQFTVEHTASAVNYIAMTGSATGLRPIIQPRGSDTNIAMFLTTKGTGAWHFLTDGGASEQFRVTHTASAVNYAEITGGATGTGPRLRAQGSDADVVLTISSKGTAYVSIGTNAGATEQMRVVHVASAVNYVHVQGGITGNGVAVQSQGSDTNINLLLDAKGAAAVRLRTGGGTAVQFEVGHVSSAVNYIQVLGGGVGAAPSLAVTGSDTNIGLVIGSKGTGAISLSTNGTATPQFQVAHIASAVNFLQARGSPTANAVALIATGSDTNVSISWGTKGTGAHSFRTDFSGVNPVQMVVAHTASAVNWVEVTGAATTARPTISAQGSDTNIGMALHTKGTGIFVFRTAAGGAEGFAIGAVASAVNYVQANPAATGNAAELTAAGSDTNVGLTLSAKGTGNVVLNPATGDIRWNKANVALGGGATPTFGTIGGSGPAAAAQRNWLRFLESDGTASFIPVWR